MQRWNYWHKKFPAQGTSYDIIANFIDAQGLRGWELAGIVCDPSNGETIVIMKQPGEGGVLR